MRGPRGLLILGAALLTCVGLLAPAEASPRPGVDVPTLSAYRLEMPTIGAVERQIESVSATQEAGASKTSPLGMLLTVAVVGSVVAMSWSFHAQGTKEQVRERVVAHEFPPFHVPEETEQAEEVRRLLLAQIDRTPHLPDTHELKAYAHGSLYHYTGTDGNQYGHSNLKVEVEPVLKAA